MTHTQTAETTPTPAPPIPELIPALYFDAAGHGPDEVCFAVTNMDMRHPEMPNQLGIQLHPDDGGGVPAMGTMLIPTGGGFMLTRVCVEALHRQLGAWLDANPAAPKAATP